MQVTTWLKVHTPDLPSWGLMACAAGSPFTTVGVKETATVVAHANNLTSRAPKRKNNTGTRRPQMKLLASLLLCTLATASNNVPLCGNEDAKISNYPYYGEEDIMDRPRYYRAFYADFQHTVTGTPRLSIAFHSDTGTMDPDISAQYECSATPTNATGVYEVHFAAGNLSWPQKNGKNLSITRLQYNATADRLVLDIFRNGTSLHMCLTQAQGHNYCRGE